MRMRLEVAETSKVYETRTLLQRFIIELADDFVCIIYLILIRICKDWRVPKLGALVF